MNSPDPAAPAAPSAPAAAAPPTERAVLRGLRLGGLHAIFVGAALPPVSWWPLALVSILPLILLASRTTRPLRAALGAGLASIPMWAFHHQYIWKMSEAGLFPLVVYLALYPAAFVWIVAWLRARLPGTPMMSLAPAVWTGLEFIRGEIVWDGYAWLLACHPLIELGSTIFWASIVGQYGVSAWLAAMNGWCVDFARVMRSPERDPDPLIKRLGTQVRLAGIVLALGFIIGVPASIPAVSDAKAPAVEIAAIQTNVPQDNRGNWTYEQRRADFEAFAALTRAAAASAIGPPDVIVWPETMFPGNALNEEAVAAERAAGLAYRGGTPTTIFHDSLMALQKELGIPFVVGAVSIDNYSLSITGAGAIEEKMDASFNSAFVVDDGRVQPTHYRKVRLTPFGEVMPYISNWEWLEARLLALGGRGMSFDLRSGSSPETLQLRIPAARMGQLPPGADERFATIPVAAPICYEVTDAPLCRWLTTRDDARRAGLMISISNDGWFDWFDGGRQNLLLMSRWRAAELRTPMVRAANTGISAAIDDRGKVTQLGPNEAIISTDPASSDAGAAEGCRRAGVMRARVRLGTGVPSVYARSGELAGWASAFALASLLALASRTGRTSRPHHGG
ncbi:MAG: apolipoprotein N-acyltransferase [Planctomycetota bacterium]|nr:apolipoprotein N-acyltransferase [Planctomycetota bacterium]